MDNATIAAIALASVAALGLALTAGQLRLTERALRRDRKLRTYDFVTTQLDRLRDIGASEELIKLNEFMNRYTGNILNYIKRGEKQHQIEKHQRLIEYMYALSRIGAGLVDEALDEDAVFTILVPEWFMWHWETFEPLVEEERRKAKQSERELARRKAGFRATERRSERVRQWEERWEIEWEGKLKRGEVSQIYHCFEWLATKKCPDIQKKYRERRK